MASNTTTRSVGTLALVGVNLILIAKRLDETFEYINLNELKHRGQMESFAFCVNGGVNLLERCNSFRNLKGFRHVALVVDQ